MQNVASYTMLARASPGNEEACIVSKWEESEIRGHEEGTVRCIVCVVNTEYLTLKEEKPV